LLDTHPDVNLAAHPALSVQPPPGFLPLWLTHG
jgi:hypothetical protein